LDRERQAAIEEARGESRRRRIRMDVKIKVSLEFSVSESGLEDALDEYDELTVEGLVAELLDKSIACDDIVVKVIDGPNNLEEYDEAKVSTG
jgi:hypothetical protein